MNFALPDSYWQHFVTEHWEKEPTLLRSAFGGPIANADQLFQAIVDKPERSGSDRFWVGKGKVGEYQIVPLDLFGPKGSDGGFVSFFQRIQTQLGERPWGVNVHNLQKGSAALWFRFRDFAHGLLSRVGLPSQACDVDTFFGTYNFTPFGIHRDDAGVFTFVVFGNRVYYTWPADYFQEGDPALHTADPARVKPHLQYATKLEAGPGDMVYWPSHSWHVVWSDGQPSGVVQFSTYFGVGLSVWMGRMVSNLLAQTLPEDNPRLFPSKRELPEPIYEASRCLRELAEGAAFEQTISLEWMKRLSADGFVEVPGLCEVHALPARVSLPEKRPLHWYPLPSGELVVACNGLLFRTRQAHLEILQELNSGAVLTTEGRTGDVTTLIVALARRRGFRESATR